MLGVKKFYLLLIEITIGVLQVAETSKWSIAVSGPPACGVDGFKIIVPREGSAGDKEKVSLRKRAGRTLRNEEEMKGAAPPHEIWRAYPVRDWVTESSPWTRKPRHWCPFNYLLRCALLSHSFPFTLVLSALYLLPLDPENIHCLGNVQ